MDLLHSENIACHAVATDVIDEEEADLKRLGITGLRLLLRSESFAIHRLSPDAPVNFEQLRAAAWYSVTRTDEELSIVAPQDIDLGPGECEAGWSCLRIAGKLDFALVGVIAELTRILADAGVSIFAVSTYDTDYILVKSADLDTAVRALTDGGHEVTGNA
jgi:hypothetical protein